MQAKGSDIIVARVLHEDNAFMTLEVVKDETRELTLNPEKPDRFLTLLFIKQEDGATVVWKPWEEES